MPYSHLEGTALLKEGERQSWYQPHTPEPSSLSSTPEHTQVSLSTRCQAAGRLVHRYKCTHTLWSKDFVSTGSQSLALVLGSLG